MLNAENNFATSRLVLPPVPTDQAARSVAAWSQPLIIDSYLPAEPDRYPAFLESRVYQGSSGKVYPLPFHERIAQTKVPHEWQAVHLENEWVRLVILPELGGRIHIGYDKVADYDFFYRNNVIKPALVGLAGPWISGGVEFNWPQHHRPATFLPTDFEIEEEPDGSVTVWCSDHDPINRMKGMHGIRLRPDSSVIEARVRLYNRTDSTQTFLWWANVAAAVNDDYQSFFPTDVHYVADHAKRAVATFPQVDGRYYGVDYPARVSAETPDADRLDWYRNIPVPTSYMVTSTDDDFFGGYDHGREAGFVHWADRTIAPGKKQWTWGNAEFGWAWDRNLTDDDGPYVELMAGAFTDNQPDFSYLAPGETKTFSQYWYPIQGIGPAHQANLAAAVRLDVAPAGDHTAVRVGVSVTSALTDATITLTDASGTVVLESTTDLRPGTPVVLDEELAGSVPAESLTLTVRHGNHTVIEWRHRAPTVAPEAPAAATEPPAPSEIASQDELFYTGQYLDQYRHATRAPEPYWIEALRRDPGDVRSHIALAARLQVAGRFSEAESHLRDAIGRLLTRVPNPADGEAHYRLGIALVHQGRDDEAREYLAKATWNSAWRVPAGYAIARIFARAGELAASEKSLRDVLLLDSNHAQATNLLVLVLRARGEAGAASVILDEHRRRDLLDQWARDLAGLPLTADAPTLLDIALEYAETGFDDDALRVLELAAAAAPHSALGQVQVAPLVQYHRAVILGRAGEHTAATAARDQARSADTLHALASRLADVAALERAVAIDPTDATANAILGSWYYDKRRYDDAIASWRAALAAGSIAPAMAALVHRNLGIAAFNVLSDSELAVESFEAARALAPTDSRLLYELDQLLARTGATEAERLDRLEAEPALVAERDDLTVVYATLLTARDRAAESRELILGRQFQPWEGGEGQVLAAWDSAAIALATSATAEGSPNEAVRYLQDALRPPASLGEARHPLANAADLFYFLGEAHSALGETTDATAAWTIAAESTGDFLNMSEQPFSSQTAYSILALRRLGQPERANALLASLGGYVDTLGQTPATVDYFATSLPSMLLFHDDPQTARQADIAALTSQLIELQDSSTESVAFATGPQQQ